MVQLTGNGCVTREAVTLRYKEADLRSALIILRDKLAEPEMAEG